MNDTEREELMEAAREMAAYFYKATAKFPAEEREGLAQDLRHRALEVADLVVLGVTKEDGAHFASFAERADDPAHLLETTLRLARALDCLSEADLASARGALSKLRTACDKVAGKERKKSAGFSI